MSSAWNQLSGNWMWEERNFSEQARKRYPELFVAALKRIGEGSGLSVEGTVSLRGDVEASVLVLHGRLRFGLDMDDLRADVKVKRGEDLLFDGVVCADNLSTDEGDEALEKTPVHVRENRNGSTAEAKQTACDIVRKSFAATAIDFREEIVSKASNKQQ